MLELLCTAFARSGLRIPTSGHRFERLPDTQVRLHGQRLVLLCKAGAPFRMPVHSAAWFLSVPPAVAL